MSLTVSPSYVDTTLLLNVKMTTHLGGIDVRRLHGVVVEHVYLPGGYTYTTSHMRHLLSPIFSLTFKGRRQETGGERTSCATVRSETPAPRRSRVEASMIPSCTEHHRNPGSGRTVPHTIEDNGSRPHRLISRPCSTFITPFMFTVRLYSFER